VAGRGRAPKADRVNKSDVPIRGEVVSKDAVGWQHGDVPAPPDGLMPASLEAWSTWMRAWFAAHWSPDDVPGLRQVVRLYDQVERGEFQRASELRLQMDTFGITPKGQQDRRWSRPKPQSESVASGITHAATGTYGHLRAVPNAVERPAAP
jgi:hypothetical protein